MPSCFSTKESRPFNRERTLKTNKQTKGNVKTGNPHAKNLHFFWTSLIYVIPHIRLHICYTTYKNKLKVDHTPHLKAKTIKFLQENIRATFHDLGFSYISQI